MARGFKNDKWPDLNDPAYQKELSKHLASIRRRARAARKAPKPVVKPPPPGLPNKLNTQGVPEILRTLYPV